MKHYFRIIEKENQYQFVLVPGNNLTMPMGYSALYDSESDCRQACLDFKEMVKTQPVSTCSRLNIQGSDARYEFYDKDDKVLFSNTYKTKINANNSMRLIIQYINSQIM